MATIEGSPWRIKAIIICFIYVTLVYGAYGVFGSIDNETYFHEDIAVINETDRQISGVNATDIDTSQESGNDFINMISGFGSYLTFGSIDHFYARLFLTSISTIIFILMAYLIYTFIRDWIPFVG